jgi:hypothetical protein
MEGGTKNRTPTLPSPSIFQIEDQEEDWRCLRASYNITTLFVTTLQSAHDVSVNNVTYKSSDLQSRTEQINYHTNYLTSPSIYQMEDQEEDGRCFRAFYNSTNGGCCRAFYNIATLLVTSTSTKSAQDEIGNKDDRVQGEPDVQHPPKLQDRTSKEFIYMDPRVPGEPLQYPPKWLDDGTEAKNVNDEEAPPMVVGGEGTQRKKDNIQWTSQQKGLSDREGSSTGAPDGNDGTVVFRSPGSSGFRGGNYTYLLIYLVYVGVLI